MTRTLLDKKKVEIQHLDTATQAIITRIDKNDRRLRLWAFITLAVLMIIGLAGIYRQTQLATRSQQHIDCIIKDLSTPLPASAKSKYIDYQTRLTSDCKIKFN